MEQKKHREYKAVNKSFRKKDSMQLLHGKPVYTADVTPDDALIVKILRSPHANAIVKSIKTDTAKKVPGVVDIYTWEDVPKNRFAIAGQTYPEMSPYDRLILDRHVRFAGDAVALIAAEDEKSALKAMRMIKVEYEVLDWIWSPAVSCPSAIRIRTISPAWRWHGNAPKRAAMPVPP